MAKIQLKSKIRDVVGKKLNTYRTQGIIPAVVYGRKVKPQPLWVKYPEFKKVFHEAGENTVIELAVEGADTKNVLIHDVQFDPISEHVSHIDFFQIRMDEKIEAAVPFEFIGESPAVKELSGIFVKNMDEVTVSCLPMDLPAKIEVDISELKTFDDHIKIKDLHISPKVKIMAEEDTVVVLVTPPRSEEEIAKLDEKVEEDVTKVEGVVKEEPAEEGEEGEMPAAVPVPEPEQKEPKKE